MVDYLPTVIDCGPFTYVASSSMTAQDGKDPSEWLSVDEPSEVVKMDLSFLFEGYMDANFTFLGSLINYPMIPPQNFSITLIVQ